MSAAAQMREAAAALVEDADDAAPEDVAALNRLAAAIRALPLAEEAPLTPREKLRRVREAREVLATARVAFVPRVAVGADEVVINAATEKKIAVLKWRASFELRGLTEWAELKDRTAYKSERPGDWRAWVLNTLRADGWDVVEDADEASAASETLAPPSSASSPAGAAEASVSDEGSNRCL